MITIHTSNCGADDRTLEQIIKSVPSENIDPLLESFGVEVVEVTNDPDPAEYVQLSKSELVNLIKARKVGEDRSHLVERQVVVHGPHGTYVRRQLVNPNEDPDGLNRHKTQDEEIREMKTGLAHETQHNLSQIGKSLDDLCRKLTAFPSDKSGMRKWASDIGHQLKQLGRDVQQVFKTFSSYHTAIECVRQGVSDYHDLKPSKLAQHISKLGVEIKKARAQLKSSSKREVAKALGTISVHMQNASTAIKVLKKKLESD